jgi:hypothetical protein
MKYIRLDHFETLLELIDKRDRYEFWTDEHEKYTKKVKNTVAWLERNAKEIDKNER